MTELNIGRGCLSSIHLGVATDQLFVRLGQQVSVLTFLVCYPYTATINRLNNIITFKEYFCNDELNWKIRPLNDP